MSAGYELFHANHIQREARRCIHRLYGIVLGLVLITVLSLSLERFDLVPRTAATCMLLGSWLFGVWITARRLRRVRRNVWCIRVAADALVGYDHARRKTRIEWSAIQRVNLTDEALVIVKSPHCFFRISTTFPEYVAISHRIVHYADRHGTAVHINDRPWHQLDVYELYPFLANEPPADTPGMAA